MAMEPGRYRHYNVYDADAVTDHWCSGPLNQTRERLPPLNYEPFPLLRLPTEIRLLIYRAHFSTFAPILSQRTNHFLKQISGYPDIPPPYVVRIPMLNLCLSNRQVAREALPVLYATVPFYVVLSPRLMSWLRHIRRKLDSLAHVPSLPIYISWIRKLDIDIHWAFEPTTQGARPQYSGPTVNYSGLASLVALKYLTLRWRWLIHHARLILFKSTQILNARPSAPTCLETMLPCIKLAIERNHIAEAQIARHQPANELFIIVQRAWMPPLTVVGGALLDVQRPLNFMWCENYDDYVSFRDFMREMRGLTGYN